MAEIQRTPREAKDRMEAQVAVRMPVDILEKLNTLAKQGERSLSSEIRRALTRHVEAAEGGR